MANLRLIRIARVVLPIAAIGLAVLAWRQAEIDSEAETARAMQRSLAATLSARLSLNADGVHATCRSGRVQLNLPSAAPSGKTFL